MTTNGMTVIEKQFMETLIRSSNRMAAALEKANELKEKELEMKKEQADALIEAVKWLK